MVALCEKYKFIKHYISITLVGLPVDAAKKAEIIKQSHADLDRVLNSSWNPPVGYNRGKLNPTKDLLKKTN